MDRLGVWWQLVIAFGLLGGMVGYQLFSPDVSNDTTVGQVDDVVTEQIIAEYYAPLIPLLIGSTTLQVSVAATRETRIKGLSNTPILPAGIGKLFVFELDDTWSIWMKDMRYPLDIVWLDANRTIVHIETNVSPDTYPESFSSPVPARYVLEVNASSSEVYGWDVGDQADW